MGSLWDAFRDQSWNEFWTITREKDKNNFNNPQIPIKPIQRLTDQEFQSISTPTFQR